LGQGQGVKSSNLTSEGYYKDVDFDNNTETNDSFKIRKAHAARSKVFELCGKILSPFFLQRKYLPPGNSVTMVLERSPAEFALSSDSDTKTGFSGCPYRIYIEEAVLIIRKHVICPMVKQIALKGDTYYLPMRQCEMNAFALPIGSTGVSGQMVFNQQLPDYITIGLVDAGAVNGQLTKSGVNFLPYNLNYIAVTVNETVHRRLSLDFANQRYLMGYRGIMRAQESQIAGNYITRDEYLNGSTLYTFDVRPSENAALQTSETGQVKLDLRFSTPVTGRALMAVVFGQFQTTAHFTKGHVTLN
jgi:hypothetical protein